MAVFEAAVLTTQGNELLIDSVAGAKIEFTRMVVGGGNYTQEERVRRALEERRVLNLLFRRIKKLVHNVSCLQLLSQMRIWNMDIK